MVELVFGEISEVDYDKGLVKVHFADKGIPSPWIPFGVPSAKGNQFFIAIEIGDHVACFMNDDFESGFVASSLYDSNNVPSMGGAGIVSIKFKDGGYLKYDNNTNTLELKGQQKINLIGDDIKISGNLRVEGKIDSTGEITAKKDGAFVTLSGHVHVVSAAPGTSNAATPTT